MPSVNMEQKRKKRKTMKRHTKTARIGSKWEDLPWKKVEIDTGRSDEGATKNHYDEPKRFDPDDLYDIHNAASIRKNDPNDPDGMVHGANDPGIFLGLEILDGSQYDVEPATAAKNVDQLESNQESTKKNKDTTEKANLNVENMSRAEKKRLKFQRVKAKRKEKKLLKKRKREEKEVKSGLDEGGGESSCDERQDIESTQISWSITTGVYLHESICASLHRLNFLKPTPIQSSTLAASILGQRDIVGAAPTGSGKTLSYLLPILQYLYSVNDQHVESESAQLKTIQIGSHTENKRLPLTALILCPTRELALQVSKEFTKLVSPRDLKSSSTSNMIDCGIIIGGMAEQKQKRVLQVKRPPCLICTPGRLWDMMSSKEYDHISDLSKLRFLVIDEADRMIAQGNFPQLVSIFDEIVKANPLKDTHGSAEEDESETSVDSDDDDERLLGLPGIRGESKVKMLSDDILKMISEQKMSNVNQDNLDPCMEIDSGEYENELRKLDKIDEDEDHHEVDTFVKRQTFVYSATLTLPASSHRKIDRSVTPLKQGKRREITVDGAIAEILEKAGAQGQAKIVNLSTSGFNTTNSGTSSKGIEKGDQPTKGSNERKASSVQLPPGLSLHEIRCTQQQKDSHLYAFLATTKQGSSGPCLVFCNSIAGVKRVGETLKTLGLPVKTLHSQMQQKARLNALDSLKGINCRSIVVASDVAARGLDIPSVASVVHYDVARAIDTFIHRAGRTARGIGDKAIGWSISLVSSSEEKNHEKICQTIEGSKHFQEIIFQQRLLSAAKTRARLAAKIVFFEEVDTKQKKKNKWFTDAAKEADLDLDETLLSRGVLVEGSRKEKQQYIAANQARKELRELLATPMRTQSFGKFLSGVGLTKAVEIEKEVRPFVVTGKPAKK